MTRLSFFSQPQVGNNASTKRLGISGAAVVLSSDHVLVVDGAVLPSIAGKTLQIVYSRNPTNQGTYTIRSVNPAQTGYKLAAPYIPNPNSERLIHSTSTVFTAGSTLWSFLQKPPHEYPLAASESGAVLDQMLNLYAGIEGSNLLSTVSVGDVVIMYSGPNAGVYRITNISGAYLTMDKPAVADSDPSYKVDVFHPIGILVEQTDATVGGTFMIPYNSGFGDLS